ncbi:hypothetical protein CY34DRAFT_803591 [Suillus luteus UH-Slu-Lm8-n1]|uniref:Uncharacterized protein n=1 Tax=Suillus luteus UH-Slu-Lm8-n1 TaxID=930992 RepID=A0A0D0BBM3_9AGAM|nr:hypothetical protein CY34DRAFT_803591 [Suillus luteus UH-Slu-Lm8-n1]
MGSTITSVHGVSTINLLDAIMEGPEKAGLSSGVRYAAAAIITADQRGKANNSSGLVRCPLCLSAAAQGRALKFIEPSTAALPVPEVVADNVRATSRGSKFRNLVCCSVRAPRY